MSPDQSSDGIDGIFEKLNSTKNKLEKIQSEFTDPVSVLPYIS